MPEPRLIFEITSQCQLRCLHCLARDRDRSVNLPVDSFNNILSQAMRYYGIRRIGLTGGEPTLHPEFTEILNSACTKGALVTLTTNGWSFPNIAPILSRHRDGIELINFSLDGAREETHDHLRGQGSYQRVMQAIRLTQEMGLRFYLQMVVTARSYTEVAEMCQLAKELDCRLLRFLYLMPTPLTAHHRLDLAPEKYVEIGAEVAQMAAKYRPNTIIMMNPGGHPAAAWIPCEALTLQFFTVDPRGNLSICGNLSDYCGGVPGTEVVGNLSEMSFNDAVRRLLRIASQFQEDKVTAIEKGLISTRDAYFPCWYCAKYFHKADWVKASPGHRWNGGEIIEANQTSVAVLAAQGRRAEKT